MQGSLFFVFATALFLTSLTLTLIDCCRANLVVDVCFSKPVTTVEFIQLCNQTLTSEECGCAFSLQKMGTFVVEKSINATTVAKETVVSSNISKKVYGTCIQVIEDAIESLTEVQSKLNEETNNVEDILTLASGAMTDITTCEDTFNDFDDVVEPDELKATCKTAKQYIGVVLRILNKF